MTKLVREAVQRTLEEDMCKYRLMPYLREMAEEINSAYLAEGEELEHAIANDIIALLFFHKSMEPSALMGTLFQRFNDLGLIGDVIEHLVEVDGLAKFENNRVTAMYNIKDKTEYSKLSSLLYPLPLVVPPSKVTRNTQNGYIYYPIGSIVLNSSYYKGDVNLEHINRVNSIPLRMNQDVLNDLKNYPKKTLYALKDRQNWDRFVKQQKEINDFYKDKEFYLTHKYDKRGRVYCQGYHVSYQSTDFTNACVEFAQGEPVV